jgi:hypothetical protein
MNLRNIYERLKTQSEINNQNIDDNLLKQRAWILRDRIILESSLDKNHSYSVVTGGSSLKSLDTINNYVENDYVENYFE